MFDHISHPKKRAFLAAFAECGEVKQSAELADISRELHYDWKAQDEEYAAAFAVAELLAADELEDEARRRAKKGGDKLLMFLLSALKPEKYKVRKEITSQVEHKHRVEIDLTALTDDELNALARLADKAAIKPASDPSGDRAPRALPPAEQTIDVLPG